jgi:D-alanine transaminase/branched-chain amino acid aminotransferase
MGNWAFINDQFVPEEKAVLQVSDLSIQRGYGIFDFFKVVNSVPVFLKEHLKRFYSSAKEMRLKVDYSENKLKKIIFELLEKNAAKDTGVRITLTGGYSADGYQLSKPNLILSLRSFTAPTKEQFEEGIRLVTYEHQRQLPHVKSIDYLMPIWLQSYIKQNSADDVLYHQNRMVSECPRSNFFIVTSDNRIVTPSKNVLHGVMRGKLIEIANKDFVIEERDLSIEEIKSAKEAFITSTTKTVLPVRQVDEYIFSGGKNVTNQIHHSLLQLQLMQVQTA